MHHKLEIALGRIGKQGDVIRHYSESLRIDPDSATYQEVMAQGIVDLVIVVDDASQDETTAIAKTLPNAKVYTHPRNRG